MALTLNVTDSTTSYDLTINLDGNGSDVLAPPPPPVLDNDTGAFDAALVQFKPDDESDLNDPDNRLLNERYYERNFDDDTLRKFYIPLNFPSTTQTITIKPTAMPTSEYSDAHLKLDDTDLEIDTGVTIQVNDLRVRPVLEVSRVAQQTITLAAGWNLVSFYVESQDSILDLLNNQAYNFSNEQEIKIVSGNNFITTTFYESVFYLLGGTLSNFTHGVGYWINVPSQVDFEISGSLSNPDITLNQGWNLVGYTNSEPKAILDLLNNQAYNFSNEQEIKIVSGNNFITTTFYESVFYLLGGTLSNFTPGIGYWINVPTQVTINFG